MAEWVEEFIYALQTSSAEIKCFKTINIPWKVLEGAQTFTTAFPEKGEFFISRNDLDLFQNLITFYFDLALASILSFYHKHT